MNLDKINSYAMSELFLKVVDKHAPVKKKVVRANHAKYISKPLRKYLEKGNHVKVISSKSLF